ncbi:MAG: L,D-transpeptidase family protein [Oscillospiraceae bacterium]|nr:L,D-transpeptidase family protein [Oscillospiraceae bacterium]
MKHLRILASILLAALLLAVPAFAEDPVAPWAEEAVGFAVEHGLMSPAEQRPRDSATRAELAHMLAALFDLRAEAGLDGTDVEPNAWYAPDMAKAVAAGLYSGTTLSPRQPLTRETAFLVLSRCFGVPDGDLKVLAQFSDTAALNEWAAAPIAGMIECGYVQGTGGKLNPQGTIARQDLANLIYRLANTVAEADGALPAKGTVVVPAEVALPEGTKIDGNLIVCAGEQPLVLRDVTVTGRIVLQSGELRLEGTSAASEIVCRGRDLRLSGTELPAIRATFGNAAVEAGTCPTLTLGDASVRLGKDVKVGEAVLTTAYSRLDGKGQAEKAVVRHAKAEVALPGVQPEEDLASRLNSITVTATVPANEPTPAAPTVSSTVRFSNVGEAAGTTCILSWYMDGKLISRDWTFQLKEGAMSSVTATASYEGDLSENCSLLVRLSDGSEATMHTQNVSRHLEQLGPPVQTMEIEARVAYRASLYSDSALRNWVANIEAGTTVTYSDYRSYWNIYVTLPDGRSGYVSPNCLQLSYQDFVQKEDYTVYQKERFVNQTNHYASDTELLVWLSRRTQKVNVFQGSQDNWKLLHTFDCCSGKNATPTAGGVFKYYSRTWRWDFDTYYVKKPMLFNGGHAFHTRTYISGMPGVLLDATIGAPRSQGCVRMYDEDVDWLWDNMKMGTTVVVY